MTRIRIPATALLALLAIVAGIAAFWSMRHYLDSSSAGLRRQFEARYAPVAVLVAARDLTPGQALQQGDLARREMPAGYLPSGTFGADQVSKAVGQRLATSLRAGDPIGAGALESRVPALSFRLPEGSRAVTVPVDEVSSQAGLVRPGDRVDLMLAEERLEGGERCVVVRSLLESLHVLATGQATRDVLRPGDTASLEGIEPGSSYSTITLDVTPEQAQQLAVGLRMGELIPMLRGAGDQAPTGLAALADGRLACRGIARDVAPAGNGARRLPVDVMVGGRTPGGFARLWVSDSDF